MLKFRSFLHRHVPAKDAFHPAMLVAHQQGPFVVQGLRRAHDDPVADPQREVLAIEDRPETAPELSRPMQGMDHDGAMPAWHFVLEPAHVLPLIGLAAVVVRALTWRRRRRAGRGAQHGRLQGGR